MTEKTTGEKIRIRAVMLCKNVKFQEFCYTKKITFQVDPKNPYTEGLAKFVICNTCKIYSRSELATSQIAQDKFKLLYKEYQNWENPVEKQYADILSRN